VLVLPAEVDHRHHALRELRERTPCDRPPARARDHPPRRYRRTTIPFGVSPALDEPPLHLEVIGALANHPGGVGALAHSSLIEERRAVFPVPVSPVSTVSPDEGTSVAS